MRLENKCKSINPGVSWFYDAPLCCFQLKCRQNYLLIDLLLHSRYAVSVSVEAKWF